MKRIKKTTDTKKLLGLTKVKKIRRYHYTLHLQNAIWIMG